MWILSHHQTAQIILQETAQATPNNNSECINRSSLTYSSTSYTLNMNKLPLAAFPTSINRIHSVSSSLNLCLNPLKTNMLPNYLYPLTPNSYTQNHYQHIAKHLNSLQLEPFPSISPCHPTATPMACHVQSSPLDFQPSHQGIDDIFSRLPAIAPQHSNQRSRVHLTLKKPRMDDF